ncbi:MAG TPA: porin family protein [Chitinophagaceae bacterium]|jgi:hypothetical protein|nr:porin family protein [Chitinophagaceae bacterium]
MKKIAVFSVTLLSCIIAAAQVELGIFAGPHTSSTHYSIEGVKQSTDFKWGFHIGADCKIPFENKLFFVPAISYKLMGYKVKFDQPSFPPDLLAKDNNTSFHEMDIDLLLQYDFGKAANHLFLRLGPSFDFILFGKEEFNLETGEHVSQDMKFSVTRYYGRYIASVVGQFGFETSKGFNIYVHCVQQLISMNNEDKGPSIRNRVVGITFGKFLRSKKN